MAYKKDMLQRHPFQSVCLRTLQMRAPGSHRKRRAGADQDDSSSGDDDEDEEGGTPAVVRTSHPSLIFMPVLSSHIGGLDYRFSRQLS